MNRQTGWFGGLFILAVICWQWFKPSDDLQDTQQHYQPDFIAKNLVSVQYNKLGLPYRGLEAEYAEHYQPLAMTLMEKPVILLYSPSGQPQWRLSGDEGMLNIGDNLVLNGTVVGKGLQANSLVKTLTTEYLELDFINNQLRSNRAVQLTSPNYQAQGRGLLGKIDQQTVELLHDTQAKYITP
ncbi:LPS export ABC transporter periplasmic protein LptC [Oceanisphaera pacifica]|uniref:LPS export ABC transporter periplasmic protein LptC n=1 Tax=Oceanisphaera pacifica TaxID=2818389 RepID=A0ABS3NFB6_9GAMM|nr:LPS export ABC transporter periplasmic protein LptC [Oceanisphaera pacifica]MBO1519261.1 LPS export ABC transporter periplasmic protein LptC [Oceanisphaera pacifica]